MFKDSDGSVFKTNDGTIIPKDEINTQPQPTETRGEGSRLDLSAKVIGRLATGSERDIVLPGSPNATLQPDYAQSA